MQCKAKRLHQRLTSPSVQCKCSALLPGRDHLGPWGKNSHHGKRNAASITNNNGQEHNKVLDIEDTRYITTSPTSKQTASSQLCNVESRHTCARTFSNYEIPFIFSHQLTAALAMEDYRHSHTYPTLCRSSANAGHLIQHGRKQFSSSSNLRSNSATHVSHTLKPKTVTLGTDTSITRGARKTRCQYCISQKRNLQAPIECELSFKMRWHPQSTTPLPYFMVQPLQPPTKANKKGHHHLPSRPTRSHKRTRQSRTCDMDSSTSLYNLVPNLQSGHSNCDIHPYAYNCMTYFQRKAREVHPQLTMTMPPCPPMRKATHSPLMRDPSPEDHGTSPSRSVLTITDPWSHHQ